MVSKETWLRVVAVVVIASFVLELFVIVLFSGDAGAGASATALPSVNPAELSAGLPGASSGAVVFVGLGVARATVTGFEANNVLQCPEGASGSGVAARVGRVAGVSNVRDYGEGVFGFQVAANATPEDVVGIEAGVRVMAVPECPEGNATSVYRLVRVSLADPVVNLTDASGKRQVLSARSIVAFEASLGRPVTALSPVGVSLNQSVVLAVQARLHNGVPVAAQGDFVSLVVEPFEVAVAESSSNSSVVGVDGSMDSSVGSSSSASPSSGVSGASNASA